MQTGDQQATQPEYQNDLERLRQAFETLRGLAASVPGAVDALCLNPTLMIMELPWQGLAALLHEDSGVAAPVKGPEHVLLWIHPSDRAPRALRLCISGNASAAAKALGVTPGAVSQWKTNGVPELRATQIELWLLKNGKTLEAPAVTPSAGMVSRSS